MPHFSPDDLIATAHALADAARVATLAHFRGAALGVENKAGAGFDPVTQADREAEAAMRAVLAERRPDDAILGEELAGVAGTSGLTWVLDPVDGTRSFMCGTPTWGVLIAVADETGPLFGMIDQPYIGERFMGGLGLAELHAPSGRFPLKTRPPRPLAEASLFTTFPEIGSPEEARAFADLAGQVRLTRYGLDCYAYALVALGQIDLVVEAGLQPYDIQAPIAVIEAAGGIVTDWRGGPAHQGGRVVAAANRAIHAEALAILSRAPD
ncbi:inositol monophosphatase family protein [Rhodovulum strictum]|uniref:Histidinol-phosphatase n=1 Tax=Rhodovulum strictum TaxID=58314 RepID=A0A844BHP3_9RHOB|nr:inositol monophosphatase family protein [Rhodovulum strictum]MRH20572.1 histidinol-phosphatase [Rhodovulum strictum]